MGKDPFDGPLWGGFSGATFGVESFDLGDGLVLTKTYAHLMAPFLMAFSPPPSPAAPHPAPWAAAEGGAGFDITMQLYVPEDFSPPEWFDRLNTIWWVAALLRLRATPLLRVPAVSDKPFQAPEKGAKAAHIWPIEAHHTQLLPVAKPLRTITEEDLNWVKRYLRSGGNLMHNYDNFNVAFQAFAECIWTSSASLALVQLWGALEQLFTTSRYHVTAQVSKRIAAYIGLADSTYSEPEIRSLYDVRSVAAHGQRASDPEVIYQTYDLLRSVLSKMLQDDHVPSPTELETMA